MPNCSDWTEVLFNVKDLCENRPKYANPSKRGQWNIKRFLGTFPPFIQEIANGKKFTTEELEVLPYFDYLASQSKGKKRVRFKMKEAIRLFYDIKKYGLKSPLDMHYHSGNKLCLVRGGRRLVILNALGHKEVPVKIFASYESYLKLKSSASWEPGLKECNAKSV